MHARHIHHHPEVVPAHPALSQNRRVPPAIAMVAPHDINWFPIVAAVLAAAALSIVFLNPAWQAAPVVDGPAVLGETTHPRYDVPVAVHVSASTDETIVHPATPTVVAALGAMAKEHKQTFVYRTRGTGMYLDEFYGLRNDQSGRWIIMINDIAVSDLASEIHDGDQVTVLRSSSL